MGDPLTSTWDEYGFWVDEGFKAKNIGKPVVKSVQLMKTTHNIGTANSVKCSVVHPIVRAAMCETCVCLGMRVNQECSNSSWNTSGWSLLFFSLAGVRAVASLFGSVSPMPDLQVPTVNWWLL